MANINEVWRCLSNRKHRTAKVNNCGNCCTTVTYGPGKGFLIINDEIAVS